MATLKLSDKEVKLILDALVFASTPDVCMNVDEVDYDKFSNLAFKVNGMTELVPTSSVKLFDLFDTPEISEKLKKKFPEMIDGN